MRWKKTALIAVIIASLFVIACNDESKPTENSSEQKTDTAKVRTGSGSADHLLMYFQGLHPKDQTKFFKGLPPEMKHALWMGHWKNSLTSAKNDGEKTFIQDMIDHLKPAYYSDTALYQKEGAGFFDGQRAKALNVLGNDTMRVVDLLYRIGGDENAVRLTAKLAQEDCECNIKKDWCIPGWTCGAADCKTDWWGCGPGFLERCDGLCLYNEDGPSTK